MKRALLAAGLAFATILPQVGIGHAAPAETLIQPGALVTSSLGSCTMNFVFETPSSTYIGTAGHCVKLGERPRRGDGKQFGTVVYVENQEAPGIDFALIRIDEAFLGAVEPSVRTYGGPTGFTVPSETALGDQLFVTGYGVVFGSAAATRPRTGFLIRDDAEEYSADLIAVNGDSGGPLLHAATGKALGTISRYNLPITTDIGPTVDAILRRVRGAGFPNLQLVTAPLN